MLDFQRLPWIIRIGKGRSRITDAPSDDWRVFDARGEDSLRTYDTIDSLFSDGCLVST